MIDLSTGRLTGWSCGDAIHPGITLEDFMELFGKEASVGVINGEHRTFTLTSQLLMNCDPPVNGFISLYFRGSKLNSVSFSIESQRISSWGDWTEQKALADFEDLKALARRLIVTPGQYSWGKVEESYDPRSGEGSIGFSCR